MILLKIFHFFGILCLSVTKDNLLKISKFNCILNYILTFLMVCLQIINAIYMKFRSKYYYTSKDFKNFMATIITDIVSLSFITITFCIYFIQNFKRFEICKCLERLQRLNLISKGKQNFKKNIWIYVLSLMTFFIIQNYYFFYSLIKKPKFEIFVFFVSTYIQTSELLIYFMLKIIKEMITIKLDEFAKSLEENFKNSTIAKQIEEFREILLIFENFQNAFGLQLAANMSYHTIMLSISVSYVFDYFYINLHEIL